jgi:predicted small lipoprotein YifL
VNLTSGSGKLALVAAAVLLLALGGCGRKSKLDLPPQATAQPGPGQPTAQPSPMRNPLGLFDPEEEDRPAAAQGQKRRIILDPILD